MTKHFKDCEREVGLDSIGEAPVLQYNWYAYKIGEVHGPFTNQVSATKISSNVEKVVDPESRSAYDDYWEHIMIVT